MGELWPLLETIDDGPEHPKLLVGDNMGRLLAEKEVDDPLLDIWAKNEGEVLAERFPVAVILSRNATNCLRDKALWRVSKGRIDGILGIPSTIREKCFY